MTKNLQAVPLFFCEKIENIFEKGLGMGKAEFVRWAVAELERRENGK